MVVLRISEEVYHTISRQNMLKSYKVKWGISTHPSEYSAFNLILFALKIQFSMYLHLNQTVYLHLILFLIMRNDQVECGDYERNDIQPHNFSMTLLHLKNIFNSNNLI